MNRITLSLAGVFLLLMISCGKDEKESVPQAVDSSAQSEALKKSSNTDSSILVLSPKYPAQTLKPGASQFEGIAWVTYRDASFLSNL